MPDTSKFLKHLRDRTDRLETLLGVFDEDLRAQDLKLTVLGHSVKGQKADLPEVTAYLNSFSQMVALGTTLVEDSRKIDITVVCNCLQYDRTLSLTRDTVSVDATVANYLTWITILNSDYVTFSVVLNNLASAEINICEGYRRKFGEHYYNFCLRNEDLKDYCTGVAFVENVLHKPSS